MKAIQSKQVPPLTAMVAASSIKDARTIMLNARWHGADAFYIQLELLSPQQRTAACLKTLFEAAAGKPTIITVYRNGDPSLNDDQRAELLLTGLKAGADICDIMGDLYAPDPNQITQDPKAVSKQKALINTIHAAGGKVLISSHLQQFLSKQEVFRIARVQEERGADIVKIVSKVNSEAELTEDLTIAAELKQHVRCDYLFLANGPYSRILRLTGPSLGVCMYLCVDHFSPLDYPEQPSLEKAQQLRNIMF